MKRRTMNGALTGSLLAAMLAIAGCGEDQGPAEQAGEQIDETVEDAQEATEGAMESAGDTMEEAADEAEQAADELEEETN